MSFLPKEQYALIEQTIPLVCVDFIPVETQSDAAATRPTRLGLIRRESPFGRVWCHLGGRILRGESVRGALFRHARDTLGTSLDLPADPQPLDVFQWFPPNDTPTDVDAHGEDPRKHAVALSFLVRMTGDPRPRSEALEFQYFSPDGLPGELWPGTETLVGRLLVAAEKRGGLQGLPGSMIS